MLRPSRAWPSRSMSALLRAVMSLRSIAAYSLRFSIRCHAPLAIVQDCRARSGVRPGAPADKLADMDTLMMNSANAGPRAAVFTTDRARWSAVRRRDAAADGRFFYSVRSTGVFCRPSCASRPARRENVAFHDSVADAIAAGFRPCKRCRPDEAPRADRERSLVAQACRAIERAEQPPKLAELATLCGLSPYHFHRLFKRIT